MHSAASSRSPFTAVRISAAFLSDVTAIKFDGMRNPKVVASSEGRNAETISPTGFTGLPRPTWQRVSSWRSVVRRKM